MFAAGKAGSAEVADAQFNYVTMLLHGDGTNGAQNNTFLDSSTNNITITRVGNTTQGTFTPYGANWSNYFDGSGDYLTCSSSATNFGTSDFTIEFWVNFSNLPSSGSNYDIISATVTTGVEILYRGTGSYIEIGSYSVGPSLQYSWTPSKGAWNHVAFVRSGTTVTIYLNGTSVTSGTVVTNYATGTTNIGSAGGSTSFFNGYLSNVRVVKSAVYTSNFTPSTTPLTAITNTSLLTCADNRFIDNSTNAFTITKNGDTSVQRFSPFSPTTAYSTSVIGGSSYMDGTGDYLYFPNNAALSFGTGDFCVEAYVYKQRAANEPLIDSRATNNASPWALYIDGSNFPYFYDGTSYTSTIAITLNAWVHVAVARSSGTLKIFVNGVQGYSGTVTTNLDRSSGNEVIGATVVTFANPWLGYMSSFRIVKGSAVYTTAFTPPTAPLTAITNTSLLLNYTNAAILDNAMMNDLETVGNAQISTSVKKYGTGSMLFDGTGDYLIARASPVWLFSGDWTMEAWIYPTSVTGVRVIFETRNRTTNASPCLYTNGTNLVVDTGTAAVVSAGTITINTWQHVAATRSGNSWRIFINGTQVGSTTTNTTSYTTAYGCCIGSSFYNEDFLGNIDDARITQGVARYTANFTAPTAAFPNN
jgi:hypothetical protein